MDVRAKLQMGLIILVGTVLAGCSGGNQQNDSTVDIDGMIGTWMEIRNATANNPRFVPQDPLTQSLQKLTFNADNTFELELVDKSGKASGEGKTSGTWKSEGGVIVFEVSEDTLKEDLKPMRPERTPGPQGFVDPATDKKMVRLRLFDEAGNISRFEKK